MDNPDYCRDYLPPAVVEKLEAASFRQLCRHLQERSDEVQNMDLMTLSGFCRNCLAKWMVVEARRLVDKEQKQSTTNSSPLPVQALNALGYEEAAEHVYGMTVGDWKKRHQKKATAEQLERYKASEPLQAKHDKALLATRGEKPQKQPTVTSNTTTTVLSNVCCQDVEQVAAAAASTTSIKTSGIKPKDTRTVGPYQPPPVPAMDRVVRIAVLTVSDRAFRQEYTTGDLSGPAVVTAVQQMLPQAVLLPVVIVPDEVTAIQKQCTTWTQKSDNVPDIIFTTGGTGFSSRDVTPEATKAMVDPELPGLMSFCANECSRVQPLASLTRGTAGILPLTSTIVANLPGNPKAVGEIMPILLPLLLHAVRDLRA